MDKLSIKVLIGGRELPLSIKPEEEENIRKAVKIIDAKVKEFETNYAVKDKRDCMAMALLHFVTDLINQKENNVVVDKKIIENLIQATEKIDFQLK